MLLPFILDAINNYHDKYPANSRFCGKFCSFALWTFAVKFHLGKLGHFFKVSALEQLKRLLEWVVVIIIILNVGAEITDKLAEGPLWPTFKARVYAPLVDYLPFILPIAKLIWQWLGIVTLVTLVGLVLLLRTRNRKIRDLKAIIGQKEREIESHIDYRISYAKCEAIFHSLASQNAERDAELFHTLFADIPLDGLSKAERHARMAAIRAAVTIVRTGLDNVLDAAKGLFDNMTGDECAACVQALRHFKGQNIEDASVETLRRDAKSTATRSTSSEENKIGLNSISERIFLGREPVVFEDNLEEKIRRGLFNTTSKSAGVIYNSVLVVAVPPVKDQKYGPLSSLCIDNWQGIAADRRSVCIHFGKELACRVGVMLYRLDYLQQEYERLQATP